MTAKEKKKYLLFLEQEKIRQHDIKERKCLILHSVKELSLKEAKELIRGVFNSLGDDLIVNYTPEEWKIKMNF